uniref:PCI domain-containing protein n=1 Tax=Panagrolaimus sp. ES5 TaxID=591445 RepID=A0AC34FGD0_9BILA
MSSSTSSSTKSSKRSKKKRSPPKQQQQKPETLLRQGIPEISPTHVFSNSKEGNKRWKSFHERVGEHNMRMVAKYYTQISFNRMAEILEYPVDEMEAFLCNLIVTGIIPDAKIHRPSRIINLRARRADIEFAGVFLFIFKLIDIK